MLAVVDESAPLSYLELDKRSCPEGDKPEQDFVAKKPRVEGPSAAATCERISPVTERDYSIAQRDDAITSSKDLTAPVQLEATQDSVAATEIRTTSPVLCATCTSMEVSEQKEEGSRVFSEMPSVEARPPTPAKSTLSESVTPIPESTGAQDIQSERCSKFSVESPEELAPIQLSEASPAEPLVPVSELHKLRAQLADVLAQLEAANRKLFEAEARLLLQQDLLEVKMQIQQKPRSSDQRRGATLAQTQAELVNSDRSILQISLELSNLNKKLLRHLNDLRRMSQQHSVSPYAVGSPSVAASPYKK